MTASPNGELATIVDRARVVLLDFDGPVCSVFAGYAASVIAGELRQLLADQGAPITDAIGDEPDPLQILRYTASLGRRGLTSKVDNALRAAELAAVRSAEPTPYAREVIVTAKQTGRRIAVVSNNSADAIRDYLSARRLAAYVYPIIGRPGGDPGRMKPDPSSVVAAVAELRADRAECVLIGDSVSDVEAAHAAHVPVIGYANKAGKRESLSAAQAVIESMADLATALSDGEL